MKTALALVALLSLTVSAWAPIILYGIMAIDAVTLSDASAVFQMQPTPGDTNYYTLSPSGYSVDIPAESYFGSIACTCYASNAVRLSWTGHSNEAYTVQYSSDQTNWQDFQVRIIGTGASSLWYDLPSSRSYRLRTPISSPANLRITKSFP